MKHTNGPDCQECNDKLEQAHPYFKEFFYKYVKPSYPNAHISWSFRDKKNQNLCYDMGKSKLPWAKSAHNFMKDGNPCARAIDLFEQDENGIGLWRPEFFQGVYQICKMDNLPIEWGGNWKMLSDRDHFQLSK